MFEAIEAYSQQILEFIRVNQAWAPPIVMLLAFGESLAFISLLIPAWAALVGIGALISAGQINFGQSGSRRRSVRRLATGCPTGSGASSSTRRRTSGRCRGTRR